MKRFTIENITGRPNRWSVYDHRKGGQVALGMSRTLAAKVARMLNDEAEHKARSVDE